MRVLVTGGAGYIGGFMVNALLARGDSVVVVDTLERGKNKMSGQNLTFVEGNLMEKEFVATLFKNEHYDGVIHFAGYISMKESMENPFIYFENNTLATLNIIEEMRKNNINNFIFSSTAGVYGNPIKTPISEDHPKNPTNPYGESKLMVERMLTWYNSIYKLNYICLRYFNAAGASLDGLQGEAHEEETHIIPNIIGSVLNNTQFQLFGTDYETPDGTAVRDYIHVLDLVEAHLLALERLHAHPGGYYYNVGTGIGHSNKEVVEAIHTVSGRQVNVVYKDRRIGDAQVLVADVAAIKRDLGFVPKHSDLETIVASAWKWHTKNENRN